MDSKTITKYKESISFYYKELFFGLNLLLTEFKTISGTISLILLVTKDILVSIYLFLSQKIKSHISNFQVYSKFWFLRNTKKIVVSTIIIRIVLVKYPNIFINEDYFQIFVDLTNAIVLGSFLIKLIDMNHFEVQYILIRKLKPLFEKHNDVETFLTAYKIAYETYGNYCNLNEVISKNFEDCIVKYMNHEPSIGEQLLGIRTKKTLDKPT